MAKTLADNIGRAKTQILAFTYYVTNNPRYQEVEYHLASECSLELRKGASYSVEKDAKAYKAKTPLTFINNMLHDEKYAHVSINGEMGYLPITKINVPQAFSPPLLNPKNISKAINDFILSQRGPINIRLFGDPLRRIYRNISYAVDAKIGIGSPKNYRANLILCADNNEPRHDESIYISYRPRNIGKSSDFVGKTFINEYVGPVEYNQYSAYKDEKDPIKLAKLACFGPFSNRGKQIHNIRAIDCFASGKPYFKVFSEGDYYELRFMNGIYLTRNNDASLKALLKSKYAPKVVTKDKKSHIISETNFI